MIHKSQQSSKTNMFFSQRNTLIHVFQHSSQQGIHMQPLMLVVN